MDSDAQLIHRSLSGDAEAYGRIIVRYQGPVYRLSYRLLGSHADAEDASSEVFFKAYQALSSFNTENRLSSWLLKITSNHCMSLLRKRRPLVVESEQIHYLAGEWRREELPATPEEIFLQKEGKEQIQQALKHLSDEDRQIIVLRFAQDLSYDEIAEIMGMPRATVGTRIHRAKKSLRSILEEGGEDHGLSQCRVASAVH